MPGVSVLMERKSKSPSAPSSLTVNVPVTGVSLGILGGDFTSTPVEPFCDDSTVPSFRLGNSESLKSNDFCKSRNLSIELSMFF